MYEGADAGEDRLDSGESTSFPSTEGPPSSRGGVGNPAHPVCRVTELESVGG